MKASGNILKLSALIVSLGIVFGGSAQEYDDMYFTKKDRKKVSYDLKPAANDSKATYESYTNNSYSDNYSAKQVNPEYIARYRTQSQPAGSNQEPVNETSGEQFDEVGLNQATYYPEDDQQQGNTIINNYYNTPVNSPLNSPFYNRNRIRFNMGMGYSPWGWNTAFGIGFGAPSAVFYDPFWGSWYDPFYDPFFYDPFVYNSWGYSPWGWNRGLYGRSMFFNPWNRYRVGYYNGLNDGLWYAYHDRSVSARNVQVGPRRTRGGVVVSGNSRSTRSSRNSVADRTSGSSRRDYSATQNEYYNRSRRAVSTNNAYSRTGNTYTNSSRSRSAYTSDYSSRSNRSFGTSRSSSSRVGTGQSSNATRRYSTSGSSRSNRSYSRGSYNRNSSGSYNRSSSGSRSRSSYSSGSSRSRSSGSYRSSGSSRSRSSGSYRSSGSSRSSSGSRSSGGGRSSRSGGGSSRSGRGG